ncbi:MAG: restriction endonuclease subunit S [Caldilineaceae bacterium]|nr:restriction endonuclease subunit S [Caldilineaceae bacterium]
MAKIPYRYENLKDSGIKWLGNIPVHWNVERAKSLFRRMQRPISDSDDIVTVFRDGEVTLRKNRRTSGFTNSFKEIGYQGIRKGDLVIHAMDAFAGAIGVSDSDGKGTPVYSVYTPEDPTRVHIPYYGLLVREMAISGFVLSLGKGIRERSSEFRHKEFAPLELPVPPLAEQQAIADYLDARTAQIDRKIELLRQKAEKYRQLKQSIINETVTRGLDPSAPMKDSGVAWIGQVPAHWALRRIKDIGRSIIGVTYTPEDIVENESVGTLVLRASNIQDDKLSMDDSVYIRSEIADQRTLRKNDVLICSRSGSRTLIGKNIVIDERAEGCSFGAFMTVLRLKVSSKFISYYLKSSLFESQSGSFGSSTINQLTVTTLNNMFVPMPPNQELDAVVAYLDMKTGGIDNLIEMIETQIEKLQELRKALINDVVTGKLRVV